MLGRVLAAQSERQEEVLRPVEMKFVSRYRSVDAQFERADFALDVQDEQDEQDELTRLSDLGTTISGVTQGLADPRARVLGRQWEWRSPSLSSSA